MISSCGALWDGLRGGFRLLWIAVAGRNRQPKAWRYITLLVTICLVAVACEVFLSFLIRDFMTALQDKDKAGFYRNIIILLIFFAFAVPVFALRHYLADRIAVGWREWLTERFLQRYMMNRTYLELVNSTQVDNPDQRICEDIRNFTKNTCILCVMLLMSVLHIAVFSVVLYIVSPLLLWVLVAYCFLGTVITVVVFGPAMVPHCAAAGCVAVRLLYSTVRIRENAEAIAFYHGEEQESTHIMTRFYILLEIVREKLLWELGLHMWVSIYYHAVMLLPPLVIAPKYFSGEVEFGTISQAGYAFSLVYFSLSVLATRFQEMTNLGAEVQRLNVLARAIGLFEDEDEEYREWADDKHADIGDDTEAQGNEEDSSLLHKDDNPVSESDTAIGADSSLVQMFCDSDALVLEKLIVQTPDSHSDVLIRELSLEVRPGESLLVMGGSGCGKTSLMRTIAGLWPKGGGTVRRPPDDQTLFVPQSPYMVIGTLRQQIMYPHSGDDVSDETLIEMLKFIKLENVIDRSGGLDTELNWAEMLSNGEQQRIGFARAFLHKPKMVFLDEATSALDEENEKHMYSHLQQQGCAYISIGHRNSLVQYHTHVLYLEALGKYKLVPSADFT